MPRIFEGGRPVPPGIILEDYIDDVVLGIVKTGKEAEVSLIERRAHDATCLLAMKRFYDFEQRKFKNNATYRAHWEKETYRRDGIAMMKAKGGSGNRRAMARGTEYGRRFSYASWIEQEWSTIQRLWDAGAPVPYPVERAGNGFVMQYIGDVEQAAPRLAQATVERSALPGIYDQFRDGLRAIAQAGVVHGDLSPYNLLLWGEQLWFIDFPQAVPYLANDASSDLMYRDVQNVCAWFVRRGLDIDAEELFAEVMSDLFEFQMTDLFVARE